MKFRDAYSKKNRFRQEKTDGNVLKFGYTLDKDGARVLTIIGQEDRQAFIESFRDDTDLYRIVKRYLAGDDTALERVAGFFGKVENLPENVIDLQNIFLEGERAFNALAPDVKSQFGNDFNVFLNYFVRQDILASNLPNKVEKPSAEAGKKEVTNETT